jgi:hypothetical protein
MLSSSGRVINFLFFLPRGSCPIKIGLPGRMRETEPPFKLEGERQLSRI